jgi:hypothetical protein
MEFTVFGVDTKMKTWPRPRERVEDGALFRNGNSTPDSV